MPGIDLALDMARHVADALDIGDRRAAEFHYQPSHERQPPRAMAKLRKPAQNG
jgi:hypothetical protein